MILAPADLGKLRFPVVDHDQAETSATRERQELFGDILEVKSVGIRHISFHLMSLYCQLRGLEQVMWDMYDRPEMLHEAMAFLEEGNRRLVRQYEQMNLLSLNNDDTYHSSGGLGYSSELPAPGYDPARIRPCDMWASRRGPGDGPGLAGDARRVHPCPTRSGCSSPSASTATAAART